MPSLYFQFQLFQAIKEWGTWMVIILIADCGIITCLRGWSAYHGITSSWLKHFKSAAFLSLLLKMIAAASEVSPGLEVQAGISGAHNGSVWRGACPVPFERLSFRAFSHRSSAAYMGKTRFNVDRAHYLTLCEGCVWWFRPGRAPERSEASVCLPSPVSLLVCIPHNRGEEAGGLIRGRGECCLLVLLVVGGSMNSSGQMHQHHTGLKLNNASWDPVIKST